jgi:hypothetical protein
MADANLYRAADFNSLRWSAADVTPADGADLPKPAAVITCAVEGTIKVNCSGGGTVTLFAVAGFVLPVIVDRVWATGTTATGIVALYGA